MVEKKFKVSAEVEGVENRVFSKTIVAESKIRAAKLFKLGLPASDRNVFVFEVKELK